MEQQHEAPTAADITHLKSMVRGLYSGRHPDRFARLAAWLDFCARTFAGEPIIFRRVQDDPAGWEIGIASRTKVYWNAPRVLPAVHAVIAGRPVRVADWVTPQINGYSQYPDNSLRNRIREQVIPWLNARCSPLAWAVRNVKVRRSTQMLTYGPPLDAPRIITE